MLKNCVSLRLAAFIRIEPMADDYKTDSLSLAKRNFLSRRIATGDNLTQARAGHYIKAHEKALKDFEDSPSYFKAVSAHADRLGGKQSQSQKPTAEKVEKARYDGSARTMPAKVSGGRDQFQSLRDQSKPRAYGKK